MREEHRANPENTRRRKQRKNKKKKKPINILITKRKRAKERRERITSHESQARDQSKRVPLKEASI